MKKLAIALGTVALAVLSALTAPAQAQPHRGERAEQHRHRVAPPPPPRHFQRNDRHHPRHDRRRLRDTDRDGVPDRYDRFPRNPYRR